MALDGPQWVNHPAATYRAETKAVQLREAAALGFDVPATVMTNDPAFDAESQVGQDIALKSIDTLLLREDAEQLFGYTTLTDWQSVATEQLQSAPATVQAALKDKLDLRVTVIGRQAWCVSIKKKGKLIDGDWRLTPKADLQIDDHLLPPDVSKRCIALVDTMGLRYGAIDLALQDGVYWFIEINPTGEWGWLDCESRPLASHITEHLTCPN